MKVAVIYNKSDIHDSDVINVFGMKTKEWYSPEIIELVASSLEEGGHNVRIIEGNMHVIEELQNFMPRVVLGERPGMVFNMAYGIQGQSRYTHIPSMLEMLGIPYVGSGPAGHAIALDKVMSKIVFLRHDLPTPAFRFFSDPDEDLKDVKFPVIVKPRMEAVSFGIRLVKNRKDLKEAISTIINDFQQQALVEEFIPGREFGVSLLGNEPNLEALPLVEIDFKGDKNGFQTLEEKTQHHREKICPADIPPELTGKFNTLARAAFNALGLFDLARVDFRMDPAGNMHILEINSMASLNRTGSFVLSAQTAGLEFSDLVNRILDVAAIRYFGETYQKTSERDEPSAKKPEQLHVRTRGYLRSHLSTIVDHIEHLVTMNTYVHNIEGVNTLGNWLSTRFQQTGFKRHIYPQHEVGNILYYQNHREETNDILLLGHLDTGFDHQNHIPFSEEHGRIYGSGAATCKGGIAIILAALQALKFARALKDIRAGVLLTTDDTLGGRFSKSIVTDAARHSRYVIETSCGDLQGGVVISCSGSQQYHIDITSSRNNRKKKKTGVVECISRKNLALLKLSAHQKGMTLQFDSLDAQTGSFRSPDHASVTFTVFFDKMIQQEKLDEQIRKIAEKDTKPGMLVQIRTGEPRIPVPKRKINRNFFDRVFSLAEMLEVHVEPVHGESVSVLCRVPEDVPCLGGFGPVGGGVQNHSEFIVRDSLIDRATLLALVIKDCADS